MATETSPKPDKGTLKEAFRDVQATMGAMARKKTGKANQKSAPDDPEFSAGLPRLWAWLSCTAIADEYDKDPARLVLTIEDSTWKATLSDNALGCSLTGAGLTMKAALANLEHWLGQKDAPWTTWKVRGKALRERRPPEAE